MEPFCSFRHGGERIETARLLFLGPLQKASERPAPGDGASMTRLGCLKTHFNRLLSVRHDPKSLLSKFWIVPHVSRPVVLFLID